MSSPGARQRRRREQYQTPRNRREVLIAVGVAVGIVAVTALLIWLLRPGGLADRQPRSSWLVGCVIGAVVLSTYLILRPSSRLKMSHRVALGASYAVIAVAAVVAVVVWPDGVIRHTPTLPTIPVPSTTTAPKSTGASTTTAKGTSSTTAPGVTSTTVASSTTTPTSSP